MQPTVHLPDLPPEAQLHTLSQKAQALTNPPSTEVLLSSFLTLLQTRWIHTFLLSPTAHHLPHLLSPTLATTAQVCVSTTTRLEPTLPLPTLTDPESHHISSKHFYSPLFSLDTLTAGIGISHGQTHCPLPLSLNSWYLACEHTTPFRFLLDSAAQTIYEVHDHAADDLLIVLQTTCHTATSTSSLTAIFIRHLLQASLPSNKPPTISHLLPALLFCHHEPQTHPCKTCFLPADANCTCPAFMSVEPAEHPFDQIHFRRAMGIFPALFDSVATKRSYLGGQLDRAVVLATRGSKTPVCDTGFVKAAVACVMRDFLHGMLADPWLSAALGEREEGLGREGDGVVERGVVVEEKDEKERELEERRRKMRIRREKNRVAAQRSNLKRKETWEGLVEEVRVWKERLEELRRREVVLRQENSRMRKDLGKKKDSEESAVDP